MSRFDFETVNERPSFKRLCLIRDYAHQLIISANAWIVPGYEHLPRAIREYRVFKKAYLLFVTLTGRREPKSWDPAVFPPRGWPDDVTAALEQLRDGLDSLMVKWGWDLWDNNIRTVARNAIEVCFNSLDSYGDFSDELTSLKQKVIQLREQKNCIQAPKAFAILKTKMRVVAVRCEEINRHQEEWKEVYHAPLLGTPARIDLREYDAIRQATEVLFSISAQVPAPEGATATPSSEPAKRQARLECDFEADPPQLILDGKRLTPTGNSAHAVVSYVAKLIELDGERKSVKEFAAENPELGITENTTRFLNRLPKEIRPFIERGKGVIPRLRVKELRKNDAKPSSE